MQANRAEVNPVVSISNPVTGVAVVVLVVVVVVVVPVHAVQSVYATIGVIIL